MAAFMHVDGFYFFFLCIFDFLPLTLFRTFLGGMAEPYRLPFFFLTCPPQI